MNVNTLGHKPNYRPHLLYITMSLNIPFYLILFLFIFCVKLYGQSDTDCSEVYTYEQLTSEPGFGENFEQYERLVNQDMMEVFSWLRKEYLVELSTFKAKMVIGPGGKIFEIKFIKPLPNIAERKIDSIIRNSTIWQAGRINEKEVCSEYYLYIGCIKWLE